MKPNNQKIAKNLIAFLTISLFIINFSCEKKKLPYLGIPVQMNDITTYPTIPDFEYFNQDSNLISLKSIAGHIHFACFFFTSCPTICPKVMRNMTRIAEHFEDHSNISYLCFSLDYKRDSIERLKNYYTKVGIQFKNFHLLRGKDMNDSKNLAQHYLSTASEDPEAAGGINHSGWILLVDKNKHIRAYADGTNDQEIDRLIKDTEGLLSEN